MPIFQTPQPKTPAPAPAYRWSGRYVDDGSAAGGGQRFESYLRSFPCGPVMLDPAAEPGAASGPGPGGPSGGGPMVSPGFPVFGTDAILSSSPTVPGYINPPNANTAAVSDGGVPAGGAGIPAGADGMQTLTAARDMVDDPSRGPGPRALPKYGSKVTDAAGSMRARGCGTGNGNGAGVSKYWPLVLTGLVGLALGAALSSGDSGGGAFGR